MNTKTIEQAPLGPERLPGESARSYRAFCVYRDLGPDQSLDLAWRRLCADRGMDPAFTRRPGHWAACSPKFHWVERAESYDDLIEEERRIQGADRRRKLEDQGSKFAMEEQERMQDLVRQLHTAITSGLQASPAEVTKVKDDGAAKTKITTRIRPPNLLGLAALGRLLNATSTLAVKGFAVKDLDEESPIERVVWAWGPVRRPISRLAEVPVRRTRIQPRGRRSTRSRLGRRGRSSVSKSARFLALAWERVESVAGRSSCLSKPGLFLTPL